jgi:hypothetical protein
MSVFVLNVFKNMTLFGLVLLRAVVLTFLILVVLRNGIRVQIKVNGVAQIVVLQCLKLLSPRVSVGNHMVTLVIVLQFLIVVVKSALKREM